MPWRRRRFPWGSDVPWGWGVWAEISADDFARYRALYDDPRQGREVPFEGTIANEIEQYDAGTLGLLVSIHLTTARLRPALTVLDERHELAHQQREGVDDAWVFATLHRYL
jgi:hypothetical protein